MKTAEIDAVFGEDMREFLESLGILSEIESGEKTCFFCGNIVNVQDVQAVFPLNNDVQICCSSFHCYKTFLKEVD